jgi:hypothetical protein
MAISTHLLNDYEIRMILHLANKTHTFVCFLRHCFFTQEHDDMYTIYLSKFVSPHLGDEPWSPSWERK